MTKGTSMFLISQTLLSRAIGIEDDYTTQLQTRKIPEDEKKSKLDVQGFLETLPLRKMEPAELLSNEISVAELAKAVEESGEDVDDPTKKRLKEFKAFIGELEDDMKDDHKQDQGRIDTAAKKYKSCSKDFAKSVKENAKLMEKMKKTEEKHMTCRTKQSTKSEEMHAACADLITYQKSMTRIGPVPSTSDWLPDPSPTCAEVSAGDITSFEKYFKDSLSQLEGQLSAWKSREKACSKASADLTATKDECAALQTSFETQFCGWRSAQYYNCAEQSTCHDSSVEDLQSTIKLASERAEIRKEHWEAAQHFKCFLDVLLHDKNMTDCKKAVDHTVFNFDIPAEADKPTCDLSATWRHPGTTGWADRFSGSECEVSSDHHKCEPIPEHILKAAAGQEKNTFVRWGHSECPESTIKLFTGFASGSYYSHNGGGFNTLCLHPEPTYPTGAHAGDHNGALLYGTEYQNTGVLDKNHDHDAICAVCAVQGATYTQWGRDQCPDGSKQEYKGMIMSNHYTHQKGMFVCVDEERQKTDLTSASDHNGNLWYTTEYEQGSLPGAVYKHDHEASCAQCTLPTSKDTYVRWGSRECPSGATALFTGYVASGHYGHAGSGANHLCLHPEPTYPPGFSSGNQNGALLYGTEYQNTGAVDKHHDQDAVCTFCAVNGATYTQWGRNECPGNHIQEYKGWIMANHYTQHKSTFVCVDEERAFTVKSSGGNHDGNLWYTTEYEQGSLPGDVFKHDHEASCAQCTAMDVSNTYVRWGHNECPSGATTFYTGYAASDHYSHRGGGANALCLHPTPTFPSGVSSGNQNGALLYGTEYQNTGAIDKHHDHDAVCAFCGVQGSTYTQWGRDVCPDGHRMEYKGMVMSNYYTQRKGEFVCVDEARMQHEKSKTSDHNGNLWYTTEFELGSLPGAVFKQNMEVSCAQCSTTPM